MRGFVNNLSWLQIPLEDQAYKLDARFAENPGKIFSVEDEIRTRDEEGRYFQVTENASYVLEIQGSPRHSR